MSLRSRFSTWWKAVSRPATLDSDVQEELSFHIESYAEDLMRSGLPLEEALRRARAELGAIAAQKENMRAAWGTRIWDELRGDLRYALRMLAKSPGFTAIAIGSLALGIGANMVIFTVAKHVLMDRLAVPHPEELRLFWVIQGKNSPIHSMWGYFGNTPDGKSTSTSLSYPVYQQMRRENHSLADLFAFKPFDRLTAIIDGQAEAVTSELVSGNYYASLGVRPAVGRPINDSDDKAPGSGPVVVISDHFWSTRFGRDPRVIGKVINLNATPMTIVGVNPPNFTGANETQISPDVFLPMSMQPIVGPRSSGSLLTDTGLWWVLVMGRMKPGTREETAGAALDAALNAAVRATMPIGKDDNIPHLQLRDGSRGQNGAAGGLSKPIWVLMSLSGFVLLLACTNLANLLLARAAARQREMSVRLALGAGRGRILRQMLTESLLLAFFGGAAGLFLGWLGRNAIPRLLSNSWEPTTLKGSIDWPIFAFTAGISILTGLLFGLAPAWQATRTQVSSGLKDNAQTVTHRRKGLTGKALVVVQVSLSMLLLVGAGLFVRTLNNLSHTHLGFEPDNLLLLSINPPASQYPEAKAIALHHSLEQRFAAVPGVASVTLSDIPLIADSMSNNQIFIPGAPKTEKERDADVNDTGEGFFSTMGIPLVGGRGFTPGDTETSTKVAVVNRQFAKEFFPGVNPVGRTFSGQSDGKDPITIVGMCGDAKYSSLRDDPPATFYRPYRQLKETGGMTYEISTRMKPEALVPLLREAARSVDRNLPLLDIRTQNEQIDATMQQERIFAHLTAGFGILALMLACIGIYGIMAYTVSRRINEIGIRMALGAQAGQVLRMVMREASWLAVIGVIAGLGGALALGRLIASMLFGLKSYDPATLASAGVLLIGVALAASWVPARRAARVDPIQALRHE
jgi:predicted permease